MELIFIGHAIRRMAERGITREEVEAVLSSPERTDVQATKVVYDGTVAGRRVRVVIARESEPIRVITAMRRRR